MTNEDWKRLRDVVEETGYMTRVEALAVLFALDEARRERDETRRMYCEEMAARAVLDGIALTPSAIACSVWPADADRLFPPKEGAA